MIIAVDFDGTIVENRYPEIGEERPFATETLKMLIKDRHRLVLWTCREGELLEAREVFSDRSVRYALRTEAKASDPAWYADIDAAGTFTSFANHRLVFVCTDASYYPGALLIITRNPNGTISARFYGKNAGGNVLDRPYCGYERVNGLGRTDDPDFKP